MREQLEFLDEKIAERGIAYYSKMDILGLYYYQSITEDDWDAWSSWINSNSNPSPLSPDFVFPLEYVLAGIAAIVGSVLLFFCMKRK